MIDFLKKNWRVLIYTVCSFALIILVSANIYQRATGNKRINNAELADLRTSVVDSVKTIVNKQKLSEIDSIKRVEAVKTFRYRTDALYWKGVAQSNAKAAYRSKLKADSLAKTKPECADVAEAYQVTVDSLTQENIALDKVNEALDNEAESYSTRLYLTEKQLKISEEIIASKDSVIAIKNNLIFLQQKQLKKENNWWNKGKFWLGFGAGFISGVLIAK